MYRRVLRRGFTLPWVILTVAIVAALAAVVAPELATIHDRNRMAAVAARMHRIILGVNAFNAGVGNYPGRISQLSNPIAMADHNSCNLTMTSTNVSNWMSSGPFIDFWSDRGGVWTEIGRLDDSIAGRASPGRTDPVYVDLTGVSSADAAMFDAYVDGATGDTVTVGPVVNDTTTVRYRLLSASVVGNNHC
jgi:Tfp pilus assembly protein PilE